jgi:multidrug resistance efflux pump
MRKQLKAMGPVLLTLAVTVTAGFSGRWLWDHYTNAPWTRDGHVRADVLQIAPDVSGLLTDVRVQDNQPVKKGQVLFIVDRARHELAVRQAQALVARQTAVLQQARREAARNHVLDKLVARESVEEGDAKVEDARAALAAAQSALDLARLNLSRTVVVSPADGYLNDRAPHTGDYVNAGRPVLSLVDAHSFHVDGYFEENKLSAIHIGQAVDIAIMGESRTLHGHVQSIAAGIEDRDRSNGSNLLPNVNPTFNWVRLAQRVPVRISLDAVPGDLHLVVGRTATVSVHDTPAMPPGARS